MSDFDAIPSIGAWPRPTPDPAGRPPAPARALAKEPRAPLVSGLEPGAARSAADLLETRLNALLADRLGATRLRIDYDRAAERYVYQSVDRATGDLLSQYPTDALLKVIKAIRAAEGLLLDQDG